MQASREQVIAYRVAAQQLHRVDCRPSDLAVLDIGVQDSGADAARLAFDARMVQTARDLEVGPGAPLALTWTLRGAPHVHRRRDLDALAAALWPLSEADAAGRLNETGPSVARAGIAALDQYALAVGAMRSVVSAPMAKGAASTEVTERIPQVMWRNCRPCKAMHISDSAMRSAALGAGLEILPGTSPPVLSPRLRAKVISAPDVTALRGLIVAYLTLLGPATPADVAGYLDARRADVQGVWPDGLVQVRTDGRTAWLPACRVDELTGSPDPDLVRLLGPFDPYLQARDRELIVPDRSVHKSLWPVLGRPGVLFVGGEVLGTWRTKASGKNLKVTVDAFAPLAPSIWTDVEAEAERVAAVRGASTVEVARA